MTSTHIILNLAGQVALLLWGIHMISTGVQRAFGPRLRTALGFALKDRVRAFLAGAGVTALLQSSTATALMVTSFSAGGAVDLVPALAVMLGANVGTTLIVQVVSFDVSYLFPALIAFGVLLHRRGRRAALGDASQAIIGLGLMLLALHLLVETMRPVETSRVVRQVLEAVTGDPLLNVLIGAVIAFFAYSSIAAMLLIMSLANAGAITVEASLAMVIGANLGSAANPVVSALGGGPERLRVPVGNMITRIAGCVLCVPLVGAAASALPWISPGPARQAANFHLLFNAALALLFIGLLPLLARALERLFPVRIRIHDPGTPQYLDEAALATPSVALSNAAREVLRMADAAESMLRGSQDAFRQADQRHIAAISRMDDVLDRLYGAVQRYVGAIGHDGLSEGEAQRVSEILALAINLEHIGDIVDKNLLDLASKRIRDGLVLSADAAERIEDMHNRLLDHLQLAVAVFMSGDVVAARRLVAEKEGFRDLERETTRLHFETMRTGQRSSIEASSLQLDITRDLKRIEAHIAATAYGLLERSGELRASRLSDGGGYDERRAPEARAVGPSTGHTGE